VLDITLPEHVEKRRPIGKIAAAVAALAVVAAVSFGIGSRYGSDETASPPKPPSTATVPPPVSIAPPLPPLADAKKFAHVRRELGIDPVPEDDAPPG